MLVSSGEDKESNVNIFLDPLGENIKISVSLIISVPTTKTPWEKNFHPVDAENLVGESLVGTVNDCVQQFGLFCQQCSETPLYCSNFRKIHRSVSLHVECEGTGYNINSKYAYLNSILFHIYMLQNSDCGA